MEETRTQIKRRIHTRSQVLMVEMCYNFQFTVSRTDYAELHSHTKHTDVCCRESTEIKKLKNNNKQNIK